MPEISKYEILHLFLTPNQLITTRSVYIATNQSLNQKVPMFLHRGFVFRGIYRQSLQIPSTTTSTWAAEYPRGNRISGVTTSSRQ